MNKTAGLNILIAPGSVLVLIAIAYAYGLVGGCPRQTPANENPGCAPLIAAGIVLGCGTTIVQYRA